jgi:hypothetical protein
VLSTGQARGRFVVAKFMTRCTTKAQPFRPGNSALMGRVMVRILLCIASAASAFLFTGPSTRKMRCGFTRYAPGVCASMKKKQSANKSVQPTGGSRFAQSLFEHRRRLPPMADAWRWAT